MDNFGNPPNDDEDLWSNGRETITFKQFLVRFGGGTTEAISLWGWSRISAVKEKENAVSRS